MTDKFLHKKYNKNHYNCAHFVCDIWSEITGIYLANEIHGLLLTPTERYTTLDIRRKFKKLDSAVSPCIVLMQNKKHETHVGVFWKGKILHLNENGVHYNIPDIATFGFNKIGYYECLVK